MSPLRWDVLITGFVLAVPVLMLGLRGDLSADDVAELTRISDAITVDGDRYPAAMQAMIDRS